MANNPRRATRSQNVPLLPGLPDTPRRRRPPQNVPVRPPPPPPPLPPPVGPPNPPPPTQNPPTTAPPLHPPAIPPISNNTGPSNLTVQPNRPDNFSAIDVTQQLDYSMKPSVLYMTLVIAIIFTVYDVYNIAQATSRSILNVLGDHPWPSFSALIGHLIFLNTIAIAARNFYDYINYKIVYRSLDPQHRARRKMIRKSYELKLDQAVRPWLFLVEAAILAPVTFKQYDDRASVYVYVCTMLLVSKILFSHVEGYLQQSHGIRIDIFAMLTAASMFYCFYHTLHPAEIALASTSWISSWSRADWYRNHHGGIIGAGLVGKVDPARCTSYPHETLIWTQNLDGRKAAFTYVGIDCNYVVPKTRSKKQTSFLPVETSPRTVPASKLSGKTDPSSKPSSPSRNNYDYGFQMPDTVRDIPGLTEPDTYDPSALHGGEDRIPLHTTPAEHGYAPTRPKYVGSFSRFGDDSNRFGDEVPALTTENDVTVGADTQNPNPTELPTTHNVTPKATTWSFENKAPSEPGDPSWFTWIMRGVGRE